MATFTDIKRRIIELGPASFQEFCDSFLHKKEYGLVHGYGMAAGTGKTTKGNPDTYFRKENGKYVLVAYTTQEQGIYSKIKEDIDKCLDASKTGIKIADIEEIICCHTSSNLSAGDDKKLHDFCGSKGIKLTIYGVDEIAYQVSNNYRSLAKDGLGLSIDTNQILCIDDFIKQCDANGMSAPLSTTFQFRYHERNEIEKALKDDSVVIVTGKAGVGKTRLVIEAIKSFSINEGYKLLCVKNNNLGIYEDLVSATEKPDKYLFFIDDANELAELGHILSYTTKEYLGYKVKVIATVRNYAKAKVISEVRSYMDPHIIEVKPFTDDEIKGFLDENLDIKDSEYIDKIVEIAEGNPRIAYMAGRLVNKEENISAINDVSQLYEAYYRKYIDKAFGDDRTLCLTAGILAVINAVILNKLDALEDILREYRITDDVFEEKIRQLAQLEVVEIHLNQVASLSDQCLANYMLYYVFFQRKIISLSEVLEVGYKHFRKGVIRSVNTILNIFESDDTKDYCKQEILSAWDNLEKNNDNSYEQFVEDFHVFNPEVGFLLAKDLIENREQEEFECESVDFSKSQYVAEDDRPLKLLTGYNCSDYIDYVIEILLEYCGKSTAALVSGYKWLENNYGIGVESYKCCYYTQFEVSKKLYDAIEAGNPVAMAVGKQWATYALSFSFRPTGIGRGNTFLIYHIKIYKSEGVSKYRQYCWKILASLANRTGWHDSLVSYLEDYAINLQEELDRDIAIDEKQFVECFMEALDCNKISFLKGVERLLQNASMHGVKYDEKWSTKLVGDEWTLFKLLGDDCFSSELEYEEYEEFRNKQIIEYAKQLSKEDIRLLVKNANSILSDIPNDHNAYMINQGLELIVQQFNEECVSEFLNEFLKRGRNLSIRPEIVLEPLNNIGESDRLLERIKAADFPQKSEWLFVFFESLPKEIVNEKYLNELLTFVKDDTDKIVTSSRLRKLRVLDKFISIEPNIYPVICTIIYDKRRQNCFMVKNYFELLFHDEVYSPNELRGLFKENVELLRDIYFYMLSSGRHVDYSGSFLKEYISLDESWIQKYAETFLQNAINHVGHDYTRDTVLWESGEFLEYFDYLFDQLPDDDWRVHKRVSEMLVHTACNDIIIGRQKAWLDHLISMNASSDRIGVIFNIVCDLNEDIRRRAIAAFLENNDNYEDFKKIRLTPNNWSGTDSLVPAYQSQIDFLESLYPYVSKVKFLKHKIRIKENISWLRERIKKEEVGVIYRHLYS